MAMKKHEACYWLNEIIGDKRRQLEHYKEGINQTTKRSKDGKQEPMTPPEFDRHIEFCKEQISEVEKQIEALDIAASSLTR